MQTKTTPQVQQAATKKTGLYLKTISLLSLLALAGFYFSGCESSQGQNNATTPLLKVPVAHPEFRKITEYDEYMGRFRAVERVEIRSRVSGYIESIRFKDGELVNKGDVLFIIDQRPFKIALKQAEAQLARAIAEEKQAASSFERVKSLQGTKAISQEEFDLREQSLVVAKAGVEAAQANVNRAKLDLEFTVVRAPISGKISEDFINVGNLISGGSDQATLLTTIVSIDPIYFYFEGNESDLLKYTKQSEKEVSNKVLVKLMGEEDFEHEGRIDFIDNEIDKGTGTFQGRAVFANPDLAIESGMFANARVIESTEHDAILIPDAIVGTDQSRKIVFIVGDSNKVETRLVELGPLYTRDLRIVRQGLSPEDQVIVGNIQKIRPGMKIDPEQTNLNLASLR